MPDNKTTGMILMTDTQYLTSKALKSLLASRGFSVQVATDGKELRRLLRQLRITLLVTDHTIADVISITELISMKKNLPETPVLVLTSEINQMQIRELHNAGLRNVSLKTDDRDELIRAVEAALKGRQHYSDGVLDILLRKQESIDTNGLLTKSEVEIVRQIATGLTTKEIAVRKQISFHTVMTHRKNIFRKLGVTSSSELLMYAMKAGLIDSVECHS
ncbi:MAG: response regulator transcription factor [Chlorobiaceae bacterium]|nr:response regulator transcription factor [Chlorobiaceae bacterium]